MVEIDPRLVEVASTSANFGALVTIEPLLALEDHFSRLDAAEASLNHCANRMQLLAARTIDYSRSVSIDSTQTASPPSKADVVDGELPPLPAEWRWLRLGEIAEVVGGITKDVKKANSSNRSRVTDRRTSGVLAC